MDFYKILAVISPFISAGLAGYFSFIFAIKKRKFDLMLDYKTKAFQEIFRELKSIKLYADGRVSYLNGHEFASNWEEKPKLFELKTQLDNSIENNILFLTKKLRKDLLNFSNNLM